MALRREQPDLADPDLSRTETSWNEAVPWLLISRGRLRIAANIGPGIQWLPLGARGARVLVSSSAGVTVTDDAIGMPPASFAVLRV
ncbi:MAG TPA: DUF3459 domain-containing protein [Streptosporangiaceae bacterium]|nr:DUF3459 domain-containing protein [Streptosporangiaceae bacterium]